MTEGWRAGACASVNGATLSTRRLQLCLSEQQCHHVEHESQLAGAWQGPALIRCFLQFVVLFSAVGKEKRGKRVRGIKKFGGVSFFKYTVFSTSSPAG